MVAVALIGVGDIGRGAHLPTLLRSPDVRLVAVADPVAEHHHAARRRSWARNDPAPAVAERVATAALDGATV